MSIHHCPKPQGHTYTRVCNSLLDDDRLAHKTVGILVRLLRHRSQFRFTMAWLTRQFPAGRNGLDAVRSALAEAEQYGYAVQKRIRDPHTGRLKGSEWIIYECPDEHPSHRDEENPESGCSGVRETGIHNNHVDPSNHVTPSQEDDFSSCEEEEEHEASADPLACWASGAANDYAEAGVAREVPPAAEENVQHKQDRCEHPPSERGTVEVVSGFVICHVCYALVAIPARKERDDGC